MWKFAMADPNDFCVVVIVVSICAMFSVIRMCRFFEIIMRGHPPICSCCEVELVGE